MHTSRATHAEKTSKGEEIERRISLDWSAFGRQWHTKRVLPLFKNESLTTAPSRYMGRKHGPNYWRGSKCPKRNGKADAGNRPKRSDEGAVGRGTDQGGGIAMDSHMCKRRGDRSAKQITDEDKGNIRRPGRPGQ